MRLCSTPHLPQEQEPLLSDWLWFDFTDDEGISFGAEYLRENGNFMDGSLRECLEALVSSHLGLFEAAGMAGDRMRVIDFLEGHEHLVLLKEPLDMKFGDNRPLLLGRLLDLPLGKIFSGSVLMLKNDDNQGEFIRSHIDYWQRLNRGAALSSLLKHSEVLFGMFERAQHKSMPILNDIRAIRSPETIALVSKELESSQSWSLIHENGGKRWYDLIGSVGQTRIGVTFDYIVSYTDVLEDILKVEQSWQDLISPDEWEIVNSLLLFQPPATALETIWFQVVKERETERWLHTPHRELDGKTPQEMLEEENGRERLLTMLDTFADQASAIEYSHDLIDYMRLRIDSV